jgi:DNA-binding MarR family transcriptional regulator
VSKKVLEILYNELERLPDDKIVLENFYVENDGDMIPVAQLLDPEHSRVINRIKKLNKSKVQFSIAYQDALLRMVVDLSSSSIKVLTYLVSKMKYNNCVYDFKYNDLVSMFGMSYSTVTKAVKELEEFNYIKVEGKRTNLVYHISPSVYWKGSVYAMYEKAKMFIEDE